MSKRPEHVLFLIRYVGDYHAPRFLKLQEELTAAGSIFKVLEASDRSSSYAHRQTRGPLLKLQLNCISLHAKSRSQIVLRTLLEIFRFKPQTIFVLGYTDELSLTGLIAGRLLGARVYFVSDNKADDQPRNPKKEKVKSKLVRRFDGALVAGERHKAYYAGLGVPARAIELGWDVVDNDYFAARAAAFRRKSGLLRKLNVVPEKYVLLVSRMVQLKRVGLALELFAASELPQRGVHLVIIGDGPEAALIRARIADLQLETKVSIRAEVKNTMMPLFYSQAEALLLVSEYDRWGLVVSEAMACGIPALVTPRCGCAGEIVHHGEDGFVWDGENVDEGAALLNQLTLDPETQCRFRKAALDSIRTWGVERFAESAKSLALGTSISPVSAIEGQPSQTRTRPNFR